MIDARTLLKRLSQKIDVFICFNIRRISLLRDIGIPIYQKVEMKLKYVAETGEIVEITPHTFKSFSYSDLINNYYHPANTYNIEISVTPGNCVINGKKNKENITCSMPINFHNPPSIFALTQSGWLPFPFIKPANILVDKNVISNLRRIAEGTQSTNTQQNEWWLRFLKDSELLINPLLYAFENSYRRTPSFDEFCFSLQEATSEILNYFPNANVVTFTGKFRTVYEILEKFSNRNSREIDFLSQTSPLIVNRVVDSELQVVQSQILEIANSLNLLGKSLAVLCVLACLYENKDGSGFLAARRLIKPKLNYTEENAYNALSDLRCLEFYIASCGFRNVVFSLCTCDRALAAFWSGIMPEEVSLDSTQCKFNITIGDHLFPRMSTNERQKLSLIFNN